METGIVEAPHPLHRSGDTGVNRSSKSAGHFSDDVSFGDLGLFCTTGLHGAPKCC